MRKLIHAVSVAFLLGGASAAIAGEGCEYGQSAKKNDLETPAPAAATATPATPAKKG